MDRIYKYNPETNYEPNGGRYLQLIAAKDLYIQKIAVAEHGGHSDSFEVKFPNIFYELSTWCSESRGSQIQRLGPLQIHSMAIAIEFGCLLCKFCLWCKCRASQH